MTDQTKVFVYGTLKPGEANSRLIESHPDFIGWEQAFVIGKLYDIYCVIPKGTGPLDPCDGWGTVLGYVASFKTPDVLVSLDSLESVDHETGVGHMFWQRLVTQAYAPTRPVTSLGTVLVYANYRDCPNYRRTWTGWYDGWMGPEPWATGARR